MSGDEAAPELDPFLQKLRAMLVYGTLAFATGFVFGAIREISFIPLLGKSAGKWAEFIPLVGALFFVASYALRQLKSPDRPALLITGIGGVMVMLVFESVFALYVMQVPLALYLESFNVLKGELFPWGLAIMALAPLLLNHFRTPNI